MKLFHKPLVHSIHSTGHRRTHLPDRKILFQGGYKVDDFSNLRSAGIYPTIRRPPKPEDLQEGDTENNNPQPQQGDMPIEKTEKSNI